MSRSTLRIARRLRTEYKVAGYFIITFSVATLVSVIYGKPGTEMFADNFWNRDSYGPRQSRTTAENVKLPNGMRGRLLLNPNNNRLSMDVSNLLGDPVPGLKVSARITRPGNGKAMLKRLKPGPDGRYHADKVDLPKGNWNITLTGHDSRKTDGLSFTFRVEKQIKVE